MKVTKKELREMIRESLLNEEKNKIRKIVKEEISNLNEKNQLNENEKKQVKRLKRVEDPYTIQGFQPDEVKVEMFDVADFLPEVEVYTEFISTGDKELPENTKVAIMRLLVPAISESGVQKQSKVISKIKSKYGASFEVKQRLVLKFPHDNLNYM